MADGSLLATAVDQHKGTSGDTVPVAEAGVTLLSQKESARRVCESSNSADDIHTANSRHDEGANRTPSISAVAEEDKNDESHEECRLADREFSRKAESSANDGVREGLTDGKEKALQQGFDSGFKQGFQLVENISIWRGFVQGLSTSIKKLDSGQEEKKQLYALYGKLLEFEQKVINAEAPLEEIRGQMEQVKRDISDVLDKLGMAHLLDTMTDL